MKPAGKQLSQAGRQAKQASKPASKQASHAGKPEQATTLDAGKQARKAASNQLRKQARK